MLTREQTAAELLKHALSSPMSEPMVGKATAVEIAVLAAEQIDTCPLCGATAWVEIDCDLCTVVTNLLERVNNH